MLKLLSSRLPGEGKSSWNRISLVNTARPQECASLRGPGLNLITQPTNDPQMASEHDSGSGKGQSEETCFQLEKGRGTVPERVGFVVPSFQGK